MESKKYENAWTREAEREVVGLGSKGWMGRQGRVARVTSPLPVKLQFTFVIPYRTAKEDVHTVPSLRK